MQDDRKFQLHQWAEQQLGCSLNIIPVSGDASFRRYFRVTGWERPLIAMDAPPDKEDSKPFVEVDRQLEAKQVRVPHIQQLDLEQGFMLLEDFGNLQLLSALDEDTVAEHYGKAMAALLHMQTRVDASPRPPYDRELLARELSLFSDWFLGRHLGIELSEADQHILQLSYNALMASALEQPKVFVHRDYHSRNLMLLEDGELGIIDFQDAVHGPLTYDLVSLLRDCYIAWPEEQVAHWVAAYHSEAELNGLTTASRETFQRWFDFMGVQRHLKAIGIFARLNHRDGKPGYLADIPRTLNYVMAVSMRHEVLKPFAALLIRLQVKQKLAAA